MKTKNTMEYLRRRLKDLESDAELNRRLLRELKPDGRGYKNCEGRLNNILLDIRNVKNLLEIKNEQ